MKLEKNVVLFGFMGTGKTNVARELGGRLGRPVIEMDDVIEEREGIAISRVFAEKGEDYFRCCERGLVQELARVGGRIIAAGGGVALNPDNIEDFRRTGILVCLNARPEVILRRVKSETHRPLLESGNRLTKIEKLLKARRRYYDLIEHQIDTSDLTIDDVVEKILSIIM